MNLKVGMRVRQCHWMLPLGYRDGVVVRLGERARGTPHRWIYVEFPGYITGSPVVLRTSSTQLTPLRRL